MGTMRAVVIIYFLFDLSSQLLNALELEKKKWQGKKELSFLEIKVVDLLNY